MTTTTEEVRYGPVRETGPKWPFEVDTYEASLLVRCPECEDGRVVTASDSHRTVELTKACPHCADSPEPGWIEKECEGCGGERAVPCDDRDCEVCETWYENPEHRSMHTCPSCGGTGHATARMTRERYHEIVQQALHTLRFVVETPTGDRLERLAEGPSQAEARLALHVAEEVKP